MSEQIRPLQPMGIVSKPILQGRLYGIDKSGKLIWPEPVEIKDQHLLTSQPPGIAGAFVCMPELRSKAKYPGTAPDVDSGHR